MTVDVARSVRKMFVDGKWIESESGKTFDAISPATGETIAQVPKGTRADAQKAIEAAHRARLDFHQRRAVARQTPPNSPARRRSLPRASPAGTETTRQAA